MDCHNCGQPINEYDLYCYNCGASNPFAEAAAASRAAGVSMSVAQMEREPDQQEDHYDDEYEQTITGKSSLLPVILSVGAAVFLIAAIIILLLNTGDSDDNRLGFTPPSGNFGSNPSGIWQPLPTLGLNPEGAETTESPGFIWTMPTDPTVTTQSPETVRPPTETTSEVEIIVNTQKTTTEPAGSTGDGTGESTQTGTVESTQTRTGESTQTGTGEGTQSGTGEGTQSGTGEDTEPEGSETGPSTEPTEIDETIGEMLQLSINRVDAGLFPEVRLYFDLRYESGDLVDPASASSYTITETLNSNEQVITAIKQKEGTSLIVLVENSPLALNQSNLSSVKTALSNLAETMLPQGNVKNKLGIISFTGSAPFMLPSSFLCIGQTAAAEQINALQISESGSDEHRLYDVLAEAVAQLHDQGYRGDLLVYTAGENSGSNTSKEDLISLVNSTGISIHFMSLTNNEELRGIGNRINGSYIELQSNSSLRSALLNRYNINKKARYLEYTSPFTGAGALDEITVTLTYTDTLNEKTADDSLEYSPPPPPVMGHTDSNMSAVQDLIIEHIDTGKYPVVRLYFHLSDTTNNLVKPCLTSSFALTEQLDGEVRSVTSAKLKDKTEFVTLVDGSAQPINISNIGIVKSAFITLTEKMLPEDNVKNRFGVSMFRDADSFSLPLLYSEQDDAKTQIEGLTVTEEASDDRPLYDILHTAVTQLEAEDYEGSILILAGGPDSGSKNSLNDLLTLINNSGIPIHIIAFAPSEDLRDIGLSSRGSYTDLGADSKTMKEEHPDSLSDVEILSAVIQAKYLWEDLYIDYQSPFSGTDAQDELTVRLVYTNISGVVLESEYNYSIPQSS